MEIDSLLDTAEDMLALTTTKPTCMTRALLLHHTTLNPTSKLHITNIQTILTTGTTAIMVTTNTGELQVLTTTPGPELGLRLQVQMA